MRVECLNREKHQLSFGCLVNISQARRSLSHVELLLDKLKTQALNGCRHQPLLARLGHDAVQWNTFVSCDSRRECSAQQHARASHRLEAPSELKKVIQAVRWPSVC